MFSVPRVTVAQEYRRPYVQKRADCFEPLADQEVEGEGANGRRERGSTSGISAG
jgi:hypothetical protein